MDFYFFFCAAFDLSTRFLRFFLAFVLHQEEIEHFGVVFFLEGKKGLIYDLPLSQVVKLIRRVSNLIVLNSLRPVCSLRILLC